MPSRASRACCRFSRWSWFPPPVRQCDGRASVLCEAARRTCRARLRHRSRRLSLRVLSRRAATMPASASCAISKATYDARIAAPMIVLLGMIDGTYDGDALFFSRDLVDRRRYGSGVGAAQRDRDAELDPARVLACLKSVGKPFDRVADFAMAQLRRAVDAPRPRPGRKGHSAPRAFPNWYAPREHPRVFKTAVDAVRTFGLLRLSRRDQRAQFPRPQFRPRRNGRGRRLMPITRAQRCWWRSTPSCARAARSVEVRRRRRSRGGRRCVDPRRYRRWSLMRAKNIRDQRLHLSVQAAAATPEAIAFYRDRFGIKRVVLPRVLTVEEIAAADGGGTALRDRSLRLRRAVRDGGRALHAVVLRYRKIAQHERGMLAAKSCAIIARTKPARSRQARRVHRGTF